MNELIPVIGGLLIGGFLCRVRPASRWVVGAVAASLFGALVAYTTGEAMLHWQFVCLDVVIVSASVTGALAIGIWSKVLLWKQFFLKI